MNLFDTFPQPTRRLTYHNYFAAMGLHVGLTPAQINRIYSGTAPDPMGLITRARNGYRQLPGELKL